MNAFTNFYGPALHPPLISEYLARAKRLRSQFGARAFECTRRDAAAHEAGHAIVFAALWARPIRLSIEPAPEEELIAARLANGSFDKRRAWCGDYTLPNNKPLDVALDDRQPLRALRAACCIVAGPTSECDLPEATRRLPVARAGGLDERIVAREVCYRFARHYELDGKRVHDLVRATASAILTKYLPQRDAIIAALAVERSLDGSALRDILADVAGYDFNTEVRAGLGWLP